MLIYNSHETKGIRWMQDVKISALQIRDDRKLPPVNTYDTFINSNFANPRYDNCVWLHNDENKNEVLATLVQSNIMTREDEV